MRVAPVRTPAAYSGMLPDFPGFPSLELDGGRARLYRVHGKTTLIAVRVDVPAMGTLLLYAFAEGGRMGDRAWITRDAEEIHRKLRFFRAGLDPLARDRPEAPSRDEAPDIRPLFERGYAYAIDPTAFQKGEGGKIIPLRRE